MTEGAPTLFMMRVFAARAIARQAAQPVARLSGAPMRSPRAERLAAPGVNGTLVSAAMEGVTR